MARLALRGKACACRMQAKSSNFKISGHKKATSRAAGKRKTAQVGHGLIDEAEVAQRFRLLGVLGILDQQHTVRPIHIALGRAYGLLYAFDFVAVPLPYLGGVDACHGFTLLKLKPCKQGFGFNNCCHSDWRRGDFRMPVNARH